MKSITRYVRTSISQEQAAAFAESGLSTFESSNEPVFDAGQFALLKNAKGEYELATGFVIDIPETVEELVQVLPADSNWIMDQLSASFATAKTIQAKRAMGKMDKPEALKWEDLAKLVADTTVGVRQRSSGNKAELIANARNVAAANGIGAEQLAALLAALKL